MHKRRVRCSKRHFLFAGVGLFMHQSGFFCQLFLFAVLFRNTLRNSRPAGLRIILHKKTFYTQKQKHNNNYKNKERNNNNKSKLYCIRWLML